MTVRVRGNLILAAAMIIGSVVLWIDSLSLKPQSALFPRLLLVIIMGCAVAIAVEQVLVLRRGTAAGSAEPETDAGAAQSEETEAETDAKQARARQWLIAVALVVYVIAFIYIGAFTATFLLLIGLYVTLSSERSWKSTALGALLSAVLTGVLYLLFVVGLSVSLPNGLLI